MTVKDIKDIKDIKDRSPNNDLVSHLESLLKYAKDGELRSMVSAMGWDDDSVTHTLVIDARNGTRRLLGEVVLLESDLALHINLDDPDSLINRALHAE